ncbi:Histone H1.3 [Manis pentadactyla]|nr:Histone H1.3 [Manis pentadactyla]
MSETAPAALATALPTEKTPVKKKTARKPAGTRRKASGPPVSELITKAVAASKERSGVSLAALKKALAATGYDVEKNNSRIKLGLKSLVNKGTLVQTKGTGASGSFKLNKKAVSGEAKSKAKKASAAKLKPAGAAKKPKKATGSVTPKKSAKKTQKTKTTAAVVTKKVAKSPKKSKAAKSKKTARNAPKAVKPKAVKPKIFLRQVPVTGFWRPAAQFTHCHRTRLIPPETVGARSSLPAPPRRSQRTEIL